VSSLWLLALGLWLCIVVTADWLKAGRIGIGSWYLVFPGKKSAKYQVPNTND
jgi:hypothetical protein